MSDLPWDVFLCGVSVGALTAGLLWQWCERRARGTLRQLEALYAERERLVAALERAQRLQSLERNGRP